MPYGRSLYLVEYPPQLHIQLWSRFGAPGEIRKQLARVDEVALGVYSILLDIGGNILVLLLFIQHLSIAPLDVRGEILTDEPVEQGPEYELLEIPPVHRAAHLIGNFPYRGLQPIPLRYARHAICSLVKVLKGLDHSRVRFSGLARAGLGFTTQPRSSL